MYYRPPLNQPPPSIPRRPHSPSLAAPPRPPSPGGRASFISPSYGQSSSNGTQAIPIPRRSSVSNGGSYQPDGSFQRRGSVAGSGGFYGSPLSGGGRESSVGVNFGSSPPIAATGGGGGSSFGRPAPTARRLSFASSSPYERPPSVLGDLPGSVGGYPASPPPSRRRSSVAPSDVSMSDGTAEKVRRPKTPPDMCSVCSVDETPEWRKGPAGIRSLCNGCGLQAAKRSKEREAKGYTHPESLEEIERELVAIGAERFRTNGSFDLPSGTRERILATQERTRRQQDQYQVSQVTKTRSRTKMGGQEKAAAASLLGLRRASVVSDDAAVPSVYPSSTAPRSPPSTARPPRPISIYGAPPELRKPQQPLHVTQAFNTTFSHSRPPVSSSAKSQPSPAYTFGRTPSSGAFASSHVRAPSPSAFTNPRPAPGPPSSFARPPSPAGMHRPSSSMARPASPGFGRPPMSMSMSRPMSQLTSSTNKMSIAHLTTPRSLTPSLPPTPTSALRRRSSNTDMAPPIRTASPMKRG